MAERTWTSLHRRDVLIAPSGARAGADHRLSQPSSCLNEMALEGRHVAKGLGQENLAFHTATGSRLDCSGFRR